MEHLIEILVGVATGLVAAEIYAHAEPAARWLVRMAAARLPNDERERRQEEWLADLDNMPGAIEKLGWGAGCHWAATLANTRIWMLRTEERRYERLKRRVRAEIVRLGAVGHFDAQDGGIESISLDDWPDELLDRLELLASELGCSVEMCVAAVAHIALRDLWKQPYLRAENALLRYFVG
jgi:hypothetical protein